MNLRRWVIGRYLVFCEMEAEFYGYLAEQNIEGIHTGTKREYNEFIFHCFVFRALVLWHDKVIRPFMKYVVMATDEEMYRLM